MYYMKSNSNDLKAICELIGYRTVVLTGVQLNILAQMGESFDGEELVFIVLSAHA